ncbi:MAG: hypothetical protein PHV68_01765, partial [Candidatus Gastranaerophilales bacterium]|nr:hypothetical protein [Candidatus Gastranaerophilales bacterium]
MKSNIHIKFLTVFAIFLFFLVKLPAFGVENHYLQVFYPKEEFSQIDAKSTFFIGHTNNNALLKINGKDVKIYPNGSFVSVFPLKDGANYVRITSNIQGSSKSLFYHIRTSLKSNVLPEFPMKIDKESIKPYKNLFVQESDIIQVSFKASTGHKAVFAVGNKFNIPMKESPKGTYIGTYKVKNSDNFNNTKIYVRIISKYAKLTKYATCNVSSIKNLSGIVENNLSTIKESMPNGKRMIPLPKNTEFEITGKQNGYYRFKLNDYKNAWVKEEDIKISDNKKNPLNIVKNI